MRTDSCSRALPSIDICGSCASRRGCCARCSLYIKLSTYQTTNSKAFITQSNKSSIFQIIYNVCLFVNFLEQINNTWNEQIKRLKDILTANIINNHQRRVSLKKKNKNWTSYSGHIVSSELFIPLNEIQGMTSLPPAHDSQVMCYITCNLFISAFILRVITFKLSIGLSASFKQSFIWLQSIRGYKRKQTRQDFTLLLLLTSIKNTERDVTSVNEWICICRLKEGIICPPSDT